MSQPAAVRAAPCLVHAVGGVGATGGARRPPKAEGRQKVRRPEAAGRADGPPPLPPRVKMSDAVLRAAPRWVNVVGGSGGGAPPLPPG
jgi:hypothetical protein